MSLHRICSYHTRFVTSAGHLSQFSHSRQILQIPDCVQRNSQEQFMIISFYFQSREERESQGPSRIIRMTCVQILLAIARLSPFRMHPVVRLAISIQ